MQGKSEGLYLYVRHSSDCKFHPSQSDRDESHRCSCVKYVGGTATDGARIQLRPATDTVLRFCWLRSLASPRPDLCGLPPLVLF
jgi:hypothetical protein